MTPDLKVFGANQPRTILLTVVGFQRLGPGSLDLWTKSTARRRTFRPWVRLWVDLGTNFWIFLGRALDAHPQTHPKVCGSPYGPWVMLVWNTCNFWNLHSDLTRIRGVTENFLKTFIFLCILWDMRWCKENTIFIWPKFI